MKSNKEAIIGKLRQDILRWEGYKPPIASVQDAIGLGPLESAFPNGVFPVGAVHEIICASSEEAAAANGLVSGILSTLMQRSGICVWIGRSHRPFAPAFINFSVLPHNIIFISLVKDKEALWVMEEALKCNGLTAVVCELHNLDFNQSRRLQLAVEHSHVTGFILRNSSVKLGTTAFAAFFPS
jgi:protein ImuA